MHKIKQTIAIGFLTAAFWGILYPGFSLLEETYVRMDGEQDPRHDFYEILEGGREKVVIKSRLWELWENRSSYVYFREE